MKKLCFYIVLLFVYFNSYGQKQKVKLTDVIIEGVITDTIAGKQNERRKIQLTISKYPFTLTNQVMTKQETYEKEVGFNEKFEFIIPAIADRFFMRILYVTGSGKSWSSYIDNIYMLEKGDRVKCSLNDNYFQFFGKGSEKLNCQSEIYKLCYRESPLEYELLAKGKEMEYLISMDRKRDSVLVLQRKVVERYATSLGPSITQIMLLNCYGLKYFTWLRSLEMRLSTKNSYFDPYYGFLNSGVYNNINLDFVSKFNKNDIDASYIYVDFIFYKILIDQIIKFNNDKSKIVKNEEYVDNIFNGIMKIKPDLIRDKLIALFVMRYQKSGYLSKYLNRAIELNVSPFYKEILLDIKAQNLSNSPFFPFNLENNYGKMVKLSDFEDKVVFVDFWFTGCHACAVLKEAMEPVFEKYRNNSKISFISINNDRDRAQWIKSIASGRYTDPDNINLFTGGKGDNHPLMKHYNLVGAPYFYLLKNGKIYTSPLPRPQINSIGQNKTFEENTGQLISIIEEAIKDDSSQKKHIN